MKRVNKNRYAQIFFQFDAIFYLTDGDWIWWKQVFSAIFPFLRGLEWCVCLGRDSSWVQILARLRPKKNLPWLISISLFSEHSWRWLWGMLGLFHVYYFFLKSVLAGRGIFFKDYKYIGFEINEILHEIYQVDGRAPFNLPWLAGLAVLPSW